MVKLSTRPKYSQTLFHTHTKPSYLLYLSKALTQVYMETSKRDEGFLAHFINYCYTITQAEKHFIYNAHNMFIKVMETLRIAKKDLKSLKVMFHTFLRPLGNSICFRHHALYT